MIFIVFKDLLYSTVYLIKEKWEKQQQIFFMCTKDMYLLIQTLFSNTLHLYLMFLFFPHCSEEDLPVHQVSDGLLQ